MKTKTNFPPLNLLKGRGTSKSMNPPGPGPTTTAGSGSHRPICSICYEDLKPIAEDLQAIPICGHVFHELCLQQWLEYCPAGKRPTCPFCKQSFTHEHPTRLYFQSIGDSAHLSSSQKAFSEADAEALAEEVRRLEAKLSTLASTFENQQTHLKKLNDEIEEWKEVAKREGVKKDEIKKEKECAEQFLRMKLEELSRKTSECSKLEERSLGLAKELAALKLATDLNLGEDEMVKLASIGHGVNHNNVVDVLKRSLALRNKSYKELMAQCNTLGRAESRTHQKLDKANEKITKLKLRLQEIEKTLEEKENGILRDLKASYKIKAESIRLNSGKQNLASPVIRNRPSEEQAGKPNEGLRISNQIKFPIDLSVHPNKTPNGPEIRNDFTSSGYKEDSRVIDLESDSFFSIDEDSLELSPHLYKCKDESEFDNSPKIQRSSITNVQAASARQHTSVDGCWSPEIGLKTTLEKTMETRTTEKLIIDDISKQMPSISVKREFQSHDSAACPGDPCFPGGLLDMDATNRNSSKWCRRASSSLPLTSSGSLIAVGADGRGGTVKVLRAHDRPLVGKAQALLPKRQKHGSKQNGQSQLEHFFGKTGSNL